jgi:hypothetical protein
MPYKIHVPLNSPALASYLDDGWQQACVEGPWAILQMEELEVSRFPDVTSYGNARTRDDKVLDT